MDVKKGRDIAYDNICFLNQLSNVIGIGDISESIGTAAKIIIFSNLFSILQNITCDVNGILDKRNEKPQVYVADREQQTQPSALSRTAKCVFWLAFKSDRNISYTI